MYQTKVWYDVICDDCHEIKATRVLESEIEETLKNHKFCVWCNRNVSLEVNRYSEYKEGDVRDDR